MFKKFKMIIAARRVTRNKRRAPARKASRKTARPTFLARVWSCVCWPFCKLAVIGRRIWACIRNIDLIGLVNLTLLISIIVLFSMLIIDILNSRKDPVVIVAEPVPVVTTTPAIPDTPAPTRRVIPRRPNLPITRNTQTRKFNAEPVQVVPVKKCAVCANQVARRGKKLYGDVIVDNRDMATVLTADTQIQGNLYLQNMRKYTLPCNIKINGNLFLRDVGMLQFCGDFTVTGNIYVSPRSSFGPIPRTARLGGQVIL